MNKLFITPRILKKNEKDCFHLSVVNKNIKSSDKVGIIYKLKDKSSRVFKNFLRLKINIKVKVNAIT